MPRPRGDRRPWGLPGYEIAARENEGLVCGLVYAIHQRLSLARPAPLLADAVGILSVRDDPPAGDRNPFAHVLFVLFRRNSGLRPAVLCGAANLYAANFACWAARRCVVLHGRRRGDSNLKHAHRAAGGARGAACPPRTFTCAAFRAGQLSAKGVHVAARRAA